MTASIIIVPPEKTSIKSTLLRMFPAVDVRTWKTSPIGVVLTHNRHRGKVRNYKR
jgi:hypothetical protein